MRHITVMENLFRLINRHALEIFLILLVVFIGSLYALSHAEKHTMKVGPTISAELSRVDKYPYGDT